jgi:hypothetical protein
MGMLLKALSCLAGIMLIQQCSVLPELSLLIVILVIALIVAVWRRFRLHGKPLKWLELLIFTLAGAGWITFVAGNYLEHRLPEMLAGQDFSVEGVIQDIPKEDDHVQRFVLLVDDFEIEDSQLVLPEQLRLSWYYGCDSSRRMVS